MSDKAFVCITGITGTGPLPSANGLYDRTSENFGGHPVYLKRGDRGLCIAHRNGDWEIKSAARKDADDCIGAFVKGGCALEKCASRVWKVGGPKGFIDQPSVKILLGEEAERKVRGLLQARANGHDEPAFLIHMRRSLNLRLFKLPLKLRLQLIMQPPRTFIAVREM
jgi:hypothetical protein